MSGGSVKVFVEGGGDAKDLKDRCREGFTAFISKAGLKKRMPRVVVCGSRNDAFDDFCRSLANGENAVLLVDAEDCVLPIHQQGKPHEWKPWDHLAKRDLWDVQKELASHAKKQSRAKATVTDLHAHLMVWCMESWFVADIKTLKEFYGNGFDEKKLQLRGRSIESVSKKNVYTKLDDATKKTKTKGRYGKGTHSFTILSKIDPTVVLSASPWAKRFVDYLKEVC